MENGKPTHFTVYTKGAGKAPLNVQFSSPLPGDAVKDLDVIDNYDYSHTVKYTPTQQVGPLPTRCWAGSLWTRGGGAAICALSCASLWQEEIPPFLPSPSGNADKKPDGFYQEDLEDSPRTSRKLVVFSHPHFPPPFLVLVFY